MIPQESSDLALPLPEALALPNPMVVYPAGSLSLNQVQGLSPAALAYLGDAVYELFVRRHYLMPPGRLEHYHRQVVAQVRAERQAYHLQQLQPHLTPKELEVVKRGRNGSIRRPRRLDPKIYQQATSLEALLGYLYLTDPSRMQALLSLLNLEAPTL